MLGLNDDPPPQPPAVPVDAISVDVGVGKTRTWRECVAPALLAAGLRGVLSVPRHQLGEEIVRDLASIRIAARVYRGRAADDPEQPGKKMCHDLERANLIEDALADVSTHACKDKDQICQFYGVCGYQRQRQERPDMWIVPHQLLFRRRPTFIPAPASVAIDESFCGAALHGFDNPRRVWLHELVDVREILITTNKLAYRDASKTADLMDTSSRVFRALALEENGRVRRAALISAEVTVDDVRQAYRLEWMRKRDPVVYPGMPIALVRKAVAQVELHNKQVANLARFWELALRTIEADVERSPWLWVRQQTPLPGPKKERTAPAIYMAWRDDIHESWAAPTLLMDATMSTEIVSQFFPTANVAGRIAAPMTYAGVRQIVDRAMTADMLIPVGAPDEHPNPTRRANVERVRRFIWVRANDVAPGRVLVVCQKGLELALRNGPLPRTVDIAHFNAITGLNAWKDVAVVIVIGRTEPSVREVERIAGVLFGAEVREVEPDEKGNIRYPWTLRGIRLRNGRGVQVRNPCHPDPRVETVRWAICEGELVQAIGRGRGVNRTDANPLRIDILTNVCLPIEVDEVTTWEKIQPSAIDVMCAHGAVPLGYRDMADAYSDLFQTRDAAKMAIRRENPEQVSIENLLYRKMFPVSAVAYRRIGSRGPAGKLLYDASQIDPLRWLTERLGEVVLLAPEDDEAEATGSGEHAVPTARGFVEHRIREGSGQPHEPVCAEVIRFDFGAPAAAEVSQFFPPWLPSLHIEIVPEFMVALPSGRSRWLASIDDSMRQVRDRAQEPGPDRTLRGERLPATVAAPSLPSYHAIVDEVTGGCYATKEDWLEATRRWIERCAGAGLGPGLAGGP